MIQSTLTLKRSVYTAQGIMGEIDPGGALAPFYSLEHAFPRPDGSWAPAIPPGTYTCQRRLSPHFGFDVFELLAVPGHTRIEIHPGNYNRDSEGCILLGRHATSSMLTHSVEAFRAFMTLHEGINSFQLAVSGQEGQSDG